MNIELNNDHLDYERHIKVKFHTIYIKFRAHLIL
jgi:hypothetical protein